jgi:hypothetical protein
MMFENPCAHTSLPQFPNFTLDHQSSPSSQTNINTDTLMPGLEKMSSLAFWGISFTFQGHHTHLHDLCDSPSPICMSGVSGMEGAFDGFIKITQEVPKPLHSSPARPISRLGKAPQWNVCFGVRVQRNMSFPFPLPFLSGLWARETDRQTLWGTMWGLRISGARWSLPGFTGMGSELQPEPGVGWELWLSLPLCEWI